MGPPPAVGRPDRGAGNFVDHDTINFTGTAADGSAFSIHLADHPSTTPNVAAAPNRFHIGHCA